MSHHVCLAVVPQGDLEALKRTVASARQLIDSVCLSIDKDGFDRLPDGGFGYICLDVRVVRLGGDAVQALPALLKKAARDATWVLVLREGEIIEGELPDFDLHDGVNCDQYAVDVNGELDQRLIRASLAASMTKPDSFVSVVLRHDGLKITGGPCAPH